MVKWLEKHVAGLTLAPAIALIGFILFSLSVSWSIYLTESHTVERVELASLSNNLLDSLQKERGMTAIFIKSEGKRYASDLSTQRKLTDTFFTNVSNAFDNAQKTAYLQTFNADMKRYDAEVKQMRKQIDGNTTSVFEAINFYSELNSLIVSFNSGLVSHSNSALGKQKFNLLYLISAAKELSGIERALLSTAITNQSLSGELKTKFVKNIAQQEVLFNSLESLSTDEFSQVYDSFNRSSDNTKVMSIRKNVVASTESLEQITTREWWALSTKRLEQLKSSQDLLLEQARQHSLEEKTVSVAILLFDLALLIVILFISTISYRVLKQRKNQSLELANKLRAVAENSDLTLEVKILTNDDLADVAKSTNLTLARLRKDFQQFQLFAETIAAASDETSSVTQESQRNIAKQKASIGVNFESTERLNASIAEDIHSITTVSEKAQSSKLAVIEGGKIVSEAVKGIRLTADEMRNVGDTIELLNTRVEDILSMVDVIKSVADQTNLLALNAAIEAARAGEQGRGFAVVADEVRALAKRTRESTEEIASVVEDLNASSSTASSSVKAGNDKANDAVRLAEQIKETLEKVTENMIELDSNSQVVYISAQNQQGEVTRITGEVRLIESMSSEKALSATHIMDASKSLSEVANNMLAQASQYRV